ncbi:MAG TPA: HAD family hydrolase [Candidatus Krumholzibacteria bacterium]|nr:HAD family hydrolase [Candidatus Krumholzibacteria bacterium]
MPSPSVRRALASTVIVVLVAMLACTTKTTTTTTTTTDSTATAAATDPLPGWNDGAAKQSIIAFVKKVTTEGTKDFVPPVKRIAVFDNDGTLWAEQPVYFQLQFAIDEVTELAPDNPQWKKNPMLSRLIAGDTKGFMAGGEKSVLAAIAATHSGITTDEFKTDVANWLDTHRHPTRQVPYRQMVYRPMIQLLEYLRANGFKTFIVSGGGVEFIRGFAEDVYGIPPEQVIGSQGKLKYEVKNGVPVLMKLPEIQFVDDGEGKPVGIQTFIGRRPIAAFGNSDGDQQMLEWTAAGPGPRLAVLIHHDDAEREWAYDRESPVGKLDKAWDEAVAKGWTVVSMKNDWGPIFPGALK